MFLLPKGNPIYENVAAAKIRVPDMLEKLKANSFSGYLAFVFPGGAEGILLFEEGKMISAILDRDGAKTTGFEAIATIFNAIFADGGSLNVYRMSKDLTMCIHALLHGEMQYKAQELKLIDIKTLLAKLKAQQMNGCLRIYTEDRAALIFYKEGNPLGFFHDGSHDIETSASESQKIAGLPGSKIDVLSTQSADELMHYDLLEMVNVKKLWESAQSRQAAEFDKMRREGEEKRRKQINTLLAALEEDLKEVAIAYVGKVGRPLVEKEIAAVGGYSALPDPAQVKKFLAGVERSAKLLISLSKIKEMLTTMETEIADRVKDIPTL